jgi:hypothetical protein
MSHPGQGQTNELLKVDAQGRLLYQEIASPVTVASGTSLSPDYNTVGEAVDAGATRVNVIGDAFEVSGVFSPDTLIIELQNSAIWDLADNTIGSANKIDVRGNGSIRYAQTVTDAPAFSSSVNLDGIDIINASTATCPLVAAVGYDVASCDFTGDCVIAGSGGLMNSFCITGDLIVTASASGCNVQHVNMTGTPVDSGVNTVLSNVRFG